jgi:hypothetical protein
MTSPFTAARARNEGFARAQDLLPELQFVQFVDGDCEVQPSWLRGAHEFLQCHPRAAVVCGRLRERFPERSIYNRLCDFEWDTPIGLTRACGGIAMFRAETLKQVGGYRSTMIAGEEPELCVRLRARGCEVHRIDLEMALHDAAMTAFSQWWRRTVRAGYAFAEGACLHGAPPERHWVREVRSARFWAMGLPAVVLLGFLTLGPPALSLLSAYPLQLARLYLLGRGEPRMRLIRASFLILGKFAEMRGQLAFYVDRLVHACGQVVIQK